ncbi:uncharacterized protein LOC111246039 isoform X2 [Varroa destructor]|nr:uncharacterized protein LOC111246039 isoform X2 [Varroa destructor]
MRTYARNGTIFMHCSLVEADFLMANRPHVIPECPKELNVRRVSPQCASDRSTFQPDRRVNIRRILPQIYGLTQMLRITLHDPPELPQAGICASLAAALDQVGRVKEVVSVASDSNTYIVTFHDYDSVDVFILLCISQRDNGVPLPISALPDAPPRSSSKLVYDCRPSTTALSHLLRVGPPNLSAAGLTLVSASDDKETKPLSDRATSAGGFSIQTERSISISRANHREETISHTTTNDRVSTRSPMATSSSANHDSTSITTSARAHCPRGLRNNESEVKLTKELKRKVYSPPSCKRIKTDIKPPSPIRQPFMQDVAQQVPASRGSQRQQHWELHKYVGGQRSKESIDLCSLGFPIAIGRDPVRAKIQVGGPSMQHVSRLHVELHENKAFGESANSLRLDCHSANGTVVDGIYVKKGDWAEIREGSSFILGDVSYLKGSDAPNQELRFTLHRASDQDASKENCSSSVHRNTTMQCMFIESKRNFELQKDHAITISDSEEEKDVKSDIQPSLMLRNPAANHSRSDDMFNEIIVLSDDDDNPDEISENNQFQQLVMKFKDEPIDDEELPFSPSANKATANTNVIVCTERPLTAKVSHGLISNQVSNAQSSENRPSGGTGSPAVASPTVQETIVPILSVPNPTVTHFSHPSLGKPACDLFKLNVTTSERLQPICSGTPSPSDSSTRPIERESNQLRSRRASSPSVGHPRSLPQIRIGFDAFRRCLLDLRLGIGDLPQPCLVKFTNYVKYSGIPKNITELTRLLFSCFCLEASARVEIALCRRDRRRSQPQPQMKDELSVISSLISQKQVADGVLRVRLIAACDNGAGRPLESVSVVLLHVVCVRRGGKQLRSRSLLGLVYSSERKDRRDRSGTVAVPDVLAKSEQKLDVVDDVLIDLNAHELDGLQLQIDQLLQIERLCEVNELKKVVSMRQMPSSHSMFLLGPPYSSSACPIWSPQDASAAQTSQSDTMQRVMTRIARTPKLSSEESIVVCAALAQILDHPTEDCEGILTPTTMLVHGAAGSGKTATLLEVALQAVLAKPQETVLVFCKWPQAADQVALKLHGLIESRGYGDRIRVTRTGRSRHPAVASITLSERAKQAHAIEHEGSLNKLKFSIGETKKVIQGLRHSLEDQLTELPLAVKRKKLQEIAQFEEVLLSEQEQLAREEKRLYQDELIRESFAGRRRRILESSNILVCGYIDVETSIIGYAFERTHGKRISLILVDQAQEISIGDLVPVMQLPVNRLVFFGDRNQSRFWRPKHTIVRNTDLFRQSAFERMIAACPQKAFYLKTQWRLPSPLDGIVNVMFYGGRLRSMRDKTAVAPNRDRLDCAIKLAALTMINVSTAELLPSRDLPRAPIQMICNVVEALAPHSSRIHIVLSFASNHIPVSLLPPNLASRCEAQFIGPDLLTHVADPNVVVLPLFNLPFVDELSRRDPPLLCSIVTRPNTSLIIVGHLTAAGKTAERIEELVQRAKRANRYINEKPAWLTKITPRNLSQYLME